MEPTVAETKFLSAWDEAVKARKELEQVHSKCITVIEECIQKVEEHSNRNKDIQTGACGLGLGFSLLTAVTGGLAFVAFPIVGGIKFAAARQRQSKVHDYCAKAAKYFNEDSDAINRFRSAAARVEMRRVNLIKEVPKYEGMNSGAIMLALRFPGIKEGIATEATLWSAYYMAHNHPETTVALVSHCLLLTVEVMAFLGPEASLVVAETVLESVPLLGVAANGVHLHMALKDQRRSSPEAIKIQELLQQRHNDYEMIEKVMRGFGYGGPASIGRGT
jgi:hypothetical protein